MANKFHLSITKLAAAQSLKTHLCICQAACPGKQTPDEGLLWVEVASCCEIRVVLRAAVAKTVENSIKLHANNQRRSISVDVVYII